MSAGSLMEARVLVCVALVRPEDRCRQHCRGFLLPQMERQQPIAVSGSLNWVRKRKLLSANVLLMCVLYY